MSEPKCLKSEQLTPEIRALKRKDFYAKLTNEGISHKLALNIADILSSPSESMTEDRRAVLRLNKDRIKTILGDVSAFLN